MDIAELTKTLAPFIPYLVQAGQSFGDEAATRFGAEAWAHVQVIWARLAERLAGKPAAKEAVDDVANRPEDTRAQGAFELQLEKLFDEDPSLRAAIEGLWAGEGRLQVIAAGDRSVAAGRDVTGSTVVTGDDNTISG